MTIVRDDGPRVRSPLPLTPPLTRSAGSARLGLPVVAVGTLLLVALVALVELVAGGAGRSAGGLRDAGPVVGWLVPVTRTALDVATFGTLGALVTAGWLLPVGLDTAEPTRRRILRLGGRWSLAWSVSALVLAFLTTAQLVGTSAHHLALTPGLYGLLWDVPTNRALVGVAVTGVVLHACSARVRRSLPSRLLLVLAALALLPLLMSGHAGSSSNHYLAAQTLVVHVLAASVWVGGLLVLGVHLRRDPVGLQLTLPRFSTLALCCFVTLAGSGALGAYVRLGLSSDAWLSAYGALVLAKTAALVALGAVGVAHRRWSLPGVAAGRRRAFLRFAAGELVVMGVATVLAVVLGRTQPPAGALTRAVPPHANLFPTVDRGIDPLSLRTLLVGGRPDVLVLTVASAALVAYLLGVARVHRSGGTWPARRTALFVSGVVLAAWSLCGGLGAYAGALFSAEVARLLMMGLVVPALVTSGAPLSLVRAPHLLERPGDRDGGRVPGAAPRTLPARIGGWLEPVNGMVALVVVLAAALMTPLMETSLRSTVAHTALALTVMAAGLLFMWPLLAVDWLPARRTRSQDEVLLVNVVAVLLLAYAGHIYTSTTLFASGWYTRLGLFWGDAAADQERSAFVVAGFAVALLVGGRLLSRQGSRPRA